MLFFLCYGFSAHAQYFASRNAWKKERKEVYFGVGISNFLGDLGGLNKVGTHYSYADIEFKLTKPSVTLGYRYRFSKNWASSTDFTFLQVAGDDKLTQEPFRHNRNLNFKSNIFELVTRIEYGFSFSKHGNRYQIKKTMSRRYHAFSSFYYFTVGIGAFYYNPQEYLGGNWYSVRQYSLEGQGLPGGPNQFSLVSVCIPMGLGAKFTIQKKWTVGIEYIFRKTFTDYIDGVSRTYYDKALLLQYKGPTAVALADPSLGLIPGATSPNADGTGAQRGNPKDKDSYMTLQVKIGYLIPSKRRGRITKAKF
ncbi:MAG: hypothetical protein JST67_01915 [Bacteroidetes bacterium]|nr:hypothetical protein [Bacteroidota bacterium]